MKPLPYKLRERTNSVVKIILSHQNSALTLHGQWLTSQSPYHPAAHNIPLPGAMVLCRPSLGSSLSWSDWFLPKFIYPFHERLHASQPGSLVLTVALFSALFMPIFATLSQFALLELLESRIQGIHPSIPHDDLACSVLLVLSLN